MIIYYPPFKFRIAFNIDTRNTVAKPAKPTPSLVNSVASSDRSDKIQVDNDSIIENDYMDSIERNFTTRRESNEQTVDNKMEQHRKTPQ